MNKLYNITLTQSDINAIGAAMDTHLRANGVGGLSVVPCISSINAQIAAQDSKPVPAAAAEPSQTSNPE